MSASAAPIGVIGGSGFYELESAEILDTREPPTPYGPASGPITLARFDGRYDVAFLSRHGVGHQFPPHQVPYRANIFALKTLGVERIVALNAVGSLREHYAPGDLVLPSDLYDRTTSRASTFFEDGAVGHVNFAEPICRTVRADLLSARAHTAASLHHGGTLVVIEGPRFSTRAESESYRSAGFSLVGMTTLPEAALAREAEICYGCVAMVTDYDVWHQSSESVTADLIVQRMRHLAAEAHNLLLGALPALAMRGPCECHDALASAFVTPVASMPAAAVDRLAPILGRYREAP